jgi:hypothetical protein
LVILLNTWLLQVVAAVLESLLQTPVAEEELVGY